MSLPEMLPALHALPRAEKLQLIQLMAADLAIEDGLPAIKPDDCFPVWTLYHSYDAAAAMLKEITAERRAARRPWPRVSLRLAIVVVALIAIMLAITLAIHRRYDPAIRYRRGDHAEFFAASDYWQIANGDTAERVEALLGPPHIPIKKSFIQSNIDNINRKFSYYPGGFEDGDEFRQYAVGPDSYGLFQFRDGRLINFDAQGYR